MAVAAGALELVASVGADGGAAAVGAGFPVPAVGPGFVVSWWATVALWRIDAICDRRTLVLIPSRLSTMTCSGRTSTRRPATVTPSVFSTVTSVPVGMSTAFLFEHPASARVITAAIHTFFITSLLTQALQWMCPRAGSHPCEWILELMGSVIGIADRYRQFR